MKSVSQKESRGKEAGNVGIMDAWKVAKYEDNYKSTDSKIKSIPNIIKRTSLRQWLSDKGTFFKVATYRGARMTADFLSDNIKSKYNATTSLTFWKHGILDQAKI